MRMVKQDDTIVEKEMNVTDHLAELRKRLIITAVFFVIFFVVGFIFVKDIYYFFEKNIPFRLHITGITDTLRIYITMASVIAVAGTLPILSLDRKSTRLNSSHVAISYAVFCLKK